MFFYIIGKMFFFETSRREFGLPSMLVDKFFLEILKRRNHG